MNEEVKEGRPPENDEEDQEWDLDNHSDEEGENVYPLEKIIPAP